MGRADPLETAGLLVTAAHRSVDEALALVTTAARRVVSGPAARARSATSSGIAAGSIEEAIAFGSADRVVVRDGRVVVSTTVTTTIHDGEDVALW